MSRLVSRRALFGLGRRREGFSLERFYEERAQLVADLGVRRASGPDLSGARPTLPVREERRHLQIGQLAPPPRAARAAAQGLHGTMRVEIDESACLAHQRSFCSVCSERCPVPSAIVVTAGRPRIDPAGCTGCGQCIPVCPAPVMALRLERRPP